MKTQTSLKYKIPSRGTFITFEGMEGSGKSAHLDALSHELRTAGFPVVVTREPGGTPLGEKIRNLIFEQNHETIDPRAELLLYLSARAQHVREVLRPSVDK
ncbi:MAG TPA: dTMP kinase, partial [Nitrospiria bacterium]|nr:dTMP kinase [Nitrospiria bacterium]